jgi:hypothetical protein
MKSVFYEHQHELDRILAWTSRGYLLGVKSVLWAKVGLGGPTCQVGRPTCQADRPSRVAGQPSFMAALTFPPRILFLPTSHDTCSKHDFIGTKTWSTGQGVRPGGPTLDQLGPGFLPRNVLCHII